MAAAINRRATVDFAHHLPSYIEKYDRLEGCSTPPPYRFGQMGTSRTPNKRQHSGSYFRFNDTVIKENDVVHQEGLRQPWTDGNEKSVNEPFDYVKALPVQESIAEQLTSALSVLLDVSPTALQKISSAASSLQDVAELINSSESGSEIRRGAPAAHMIFGTAQSINSANHMYFKVLQDMSHNAKVFEVVLEEAINMHRGQGLDLYWRDSHECPSEEDYMAMACDKHGWVFRLILRAMIAESSGRAPESDMQNLLSLMDNIGVLIQVLSDHHHLSEDLTAGRFCLPAIYTIKLDPHNHLVQHVLQQKPKNPIVVKHTADYIKHSGGLDHTRNVARDLAMRCTGLIGQLEKSRVLRNKWENMRRVVDGLMAQMDRIE